MSQTRDAIRTYLQPGWLQRKVDEFIEFQQTEVQHVRQCIDNVATAFSYSDAQRDAIFDEFVKQGDTSYFGVTQAMTFVAQEQESGDAQYDMEVDATAVLPRLKKLDVDKTLTRKRAGQDN